MTLYEMSKAAQELYELLEAGEIDEQTVTDTMEGIGASEKLESYVYVQKQLEAEITAYKAEIERMTNTVRSLENHVKRLKTAQIEFMQATGQKTANAGLFKLSLRRTTSCEIMDEGLIPVEYMVEVPAELKADKKLILAALREGKKVAGASLKTGCALIVK